MLFDDETRKQIVSSLTAVGPAKPIGYLPLGTVSNLLGMSVDVVIAETNSRGLVAVSIGSAFCCINGGALYVYDRKALRELLSTSTHLLTNNGLATEPDDFVLQIAATWFEHSHPVYPIIAAAFGDKA